MADTKIAAILRAGAYSPNHIGNDAAIINLTCEQLRKRGCQVKTYSEEQLIAGAVKEPIVIHMCRDQRSFPILQAMEDSGRLVINSGYGVENCTRERLTRILLGSGIPYPESLMVNTNQTVTEQMERIGMERAWIKRGDTYAMHKEDVTYVRHPEEAQEVLQEYFLRGIKRAVINRHLDGDQVKFYGVRDTDYFYCFYPFEKTYSSKGDDKAPRRGGEEARFDIDKFRDACDRAADILDIRIYGGDAIIDPEGNFSIIDFNDWPSFAPCRVEASGVIARAILAEIKKRK
ncbi:MAG: hypothetical protein OSJ41_03100 [Duncaniella sp.]|jgi:hypothetical protein|uniref:hypothetical protein n=1 Tax=Duncaniella muricolitica TaxID=2880704 RepID=UPI000AE4FD66|nr:hypothetical protein [Duncaniella muricolitica]MCX4368482.1 hypothetical protein [Duncaniella sp.]MDE5927163.1 hypothetical protein [Duncaniella sp.]ROT22165.1 hypothetical protein EEL51_03130 [Muribaculaceae bacterium Isolate-110 (HZI)]